MTKPQLPPVSTLRQLLHYDPLTGVITYLQPAGPKRIGDPAGTIRQGQRFIFIAGRYRRASAVAWALHHGIYPALHPAGPYVAFRDHDHLNLKLSNLYLSPTLPQRPKGFPKGTRRIKRPIEQLIRRRGQRWEAFIAEAGSRTSLGTYDTKAEAMQARAAAINRDGTPFPATSREKIANMRDVEGYSWARTSAGRAPRIMAEGVSPDDFPMKRTSFGAVPLGKIFWYRPNAGEDAGHWFIKKGERGAYSCDMQHNFYKPFRRVVRVYVPITLERIFAGI